MPSQDHEIRPMTEASEEGIAIGRRRLLRGSAAAAASFLLTRFATAERRSDSEFFGRWRELAGRLLDDSEIGEEEYIRELSRDISLLPLDSVPRRSEVRFDKNGLRTGPAWTGGAIFLVEVTIAPGATVRPHNHPSHNSINVGLSGSCSYEHYEIHGPAPVPEEGTPAFTVRQTRSGLLETGRMAELTKTRDNIHTFRAGDEGATILDFCTEVGNPTTNFSVLEIDPEPKDAERRLHEARWIGIPYR